MNWLIGFWSLRRVLERPLMPCLTVGWGVFILHFALCTLHFAFCILHSLRPIRTDTLGATQKHHDG